MSPLTTANSLHRLARDFGTLLGDFTEQVDVLLTQPGVECARSVPEIRREVCVAVWAAITAAFEASAMSREEKQKLAPLLQEKLIPFWEKHCASDPDVAQRMSERASVYLEQRNPRSQVATATHIVQRLLDEIGATRKRELARRLIPLFAHRMLGDTHHINDLRMRFGLQLPIIATLCITAAITQAVQPALRVLRSAGASAQVLVVPQPLELHAERVETGEQVEHEVRFER
jgi:hypothetical protein